MKVECWLKIEGKRRGLYRQVGKIEAKKIKPSTEENEIAVKLIIDVPDSLFEQSVLEVKIDMPDVPTKIERIAEVSKAISDEIKKQTGFKLKVDFPRETEDAKI